MTVKKGLKILGKAYRLGALKGDYYADHRVFKLFENKYPDIAHQVEIDWWGGE